MSDEEPLKVDVEEPNENEKRWQVVALIFGYNELTKIAGTLGEKIYCRLMCRAYEEKCKEMGWNVEVKELEESLITITQHLPHINLYPRDIELMRKAVKDFDDARADQERG